MEILIEGVLNVLILLAPFVYLAENLKISFERYCVVKNCGSYEINQILSQRKMERFIIIRMCVIYYIGCCTRIFPDNASEENQFGRDSENPRHRRSRLNQKLYDYRAVLTVYNILNALDQHFNMQNGHAAVAPVEKTPQPGVAKWTPTEERPDGNIIGAKAKKIYINDNLSTLDRIVLCFAEFLGTGMLVFIGCMGCANMGSLPDPMKVAFAFGLAITIAVQCFGHISGSHINPAVTVAAVILGHTPVMHIPLYFIGQMLGGIGGFGLLKALSPLEATEPIVNGTTTPICSPGPLSADIHPWQGVCVEFALTFILVMLCAAVWDCRNTERVDSLSIRLGLAVAVLAMVGGSYTGANMNPARSFGPALINGDWKDWWVWWVGPMLGGLVAGLLYRVVFSKEYDMLEHSIAEVVPMNERA